MQWFQLCAKNNKSVRGGITVWNHKGGKQSCRCLVETIHGRRGGVLCRLYGFWCGPGTVGIWEMVGVRSRAPFLSSSSFRLANPFPRYLYPYSFQSNTVYRKPVMILASLLTMLLPLALISTTSAQDAQIVLDSIHNATKLSGTWSSGAKRVLTGAVSSLLIRRL